MLKQVSLSVQGTSPFRDLALKHSSTITVVECKQLDSRGILLLVEIDSAEPSELINDLRKVGGVRHVYWAGNGERGALAMLTMYAPLYCRISRDSGALCTTCPFNSAGGDGEGRSWKILVRDSSVLTACLGKLEEHGIPAEVREISNASHKDLLTQKQREALEVAMRSGYFCFPRETDLTTLAKKLSMKPATLSEILRRAENKVVQYYLDSQPLSRHFPSGYIPPTRERTEGSSAAFVSID